MPPTNRADDSLLAQHVLDEQMRYAAIEKTLAEIKEMFTDVNSAFLVDQRSNKPDYVGHAAAHMAWIDAQRARKDFWNKMSFELTKWGLLGFLGWLLASAVWPAIVKGHV